MKWYKLVNKQPVPCSSAEANALLGDQYARIVAKDKIGAVEVSTVFLCLDHGFADGEPPLLFETMVFGAKGDLEDSGERYYTWNEALDGHERWVKKVRETLLGE